MAKEIATFGAGCFWHVQHGFDEIKGVVKTTVGYSGGHVDNPTYKQVCAGDTGHAEVCQVEFDSSVITFEHLVKVFFQLHDPTTLNRQGADVGSQYRSAIFYHSTKQKKTAEKVITLFNDSGKFSNPIVTEVVAFEKFYPAEDYHQKYFEKTGKRSCGIYLEDYYAFLLYIS